MLAPPEKFTLKDAAGVEHDYSVTLHPAKHGRLIMVQGAQALTGLGASAVGMAMRNKGGKDGEAGSSSLAFPKVMELLMDDILAHTTRDTLPLVSELNGVYTPTVHFDQAYQRNYGELLKAVTEVSRRNGFFPPDLFWQIVGQFATPVELQSIQAIWNKMRSRVQSAKE